MGSRCGLSSPDVPQQSATVHTAKHYFCLCSFYASYPGLPRLPIRIFCPLHPRLPANAQNDANRQLITLRVTCTCQHDYPVPGKVMDCHRSGSRGPGVDVEAGVGADAKGLRKSGRRHALPPMVAMLKVWAPNEATAALLSEGSELRLHR